MDNMKKTAALCVLLALTAGKALSYNNVYYSAEDRKYMRIHQDFVSDVPASVTRGTVKTSSAASIRGYQLSDSKMLCQYLVHRTDQTVPVTGQVDTVTPAFDSGRGFWMDPATGDTLARFATGAGTQAVPIPDFYVDIVLKIVSAAAPAAQKRPAMPAIEVLACPNPLSSRTEIRLSGLPLDPSTRLTIVDIRGRTIMDLSRRIRDNRAVWDAGRAASGLYVAVLKCGKTVVRKKLVFMK
jgi:hypothetical protein